MKHIFSEKTKFTQKQKKHLFTLISKFFKTKNPITKAFLFKAIKKTNGVLSLSYIKQTKDKAKGLHCKTTDGYYQVYNVNSFISRKVFLNDFGMIKRVNHELEPTSVYYACVGSIQNDKVRYLDQWIESSSKVYDFTNSICMDKTNYYSLRGITDVSRAKIKTNSEEYKINETISPVINKAKAIKEDFKDYIL